jgi:DMSO/TMAO reductase YedYZ heme-binding membrane subunit
MWYLSRSTGIVAVLLAAAALVWGFLFSARETGTRLRPAWWLDLHNWLGGAALAFTGAHIVTVLADSFSGVRIVDAVVPGTATSNRLPLALGVVATYTFAVAVFTSWPKRRFRRPVWRALHLTSVVGVGLAMLHTWQIGTDVGGRVSQVITTLAIAVSVYALSLRLLGLVESPER